MMTPPNPENKSSNKKIVVDEPRIEYKTTHITKALFSVEKYLACGREYQMADVARRASEYIKFLEEKLNAVKGAEQ